MAIFFIILYLVTWSLIIKINLIKANASTESYVSKPKKTITPVSKPRKPKFVQMLSIEEAMIKNLLDSNNKASEITSIDVDELNEEIALLQKQNHPKEKIKNSQDSKIFKNYVYLKKNLAGDSKPEIMNKRVKELENFWRFKVKEWLLYYKRDLLEKKHNNEEVICKMCEMDMKMSTFEQHIELCKKKAELQKYINQLDNKLSNVILQAFIEARTIQRNLNVNK